MGWDAQSVIFKKHVLEPKGKKLLLTGNHAAAYAARLARAEVVSAYPITPQTQVVEKIAEFISEGEYTPRFITVESEHSALASLIAAAAAGARTFTATSAQGLLLMHELLHWASAARHPIVMVNVNRAVAPPWSVWADHTDTVSQRDTGWLQFYAESNQEILDTVLQAYKICESPDILLPAIITQDAFFLSHTSMPVDIPDQKLVDEFLPPFNPPFRLDVNKPVMGWGSLSMPHQWFPELRYNIALAMERAHEKIIEVEREFEQHFARSYGGLLDLYRCTDADIVLVCAGTMAGTVREVVDWLRTKGKKVGLARLRVFRPFPVAEFRALARRVKVIGVMDRSFTFGFEGAFFTETKAALYSLSERPIIKNFVIGIGGRDVTIKDVVALYENCYKIMDKGLDTEVEWIGIKK